MLAGEIKDNVRSNLDDSGVTFYSEEDIAESVQDAYDDVAFQTQCIVKRVSLDFPLKPYINFREHVVDFMSTIAIYNGNTNRWLLDCFTLREFDKMRDDWELWTGTPNYRASASFELEVILPYYSSAPTEQMTLVYAASAPTITSNDDEILIAVDFKDLLEQYAMADLLEQAEEFSKALEFWNLYIQGVEDYKDRVKRLARRDLIQRA